MMKKIFMTLLMGLIMSIGAMAQDVTVVEKKDSRSFFDNTYVSVNGGVMTPFQNEAFFKDLNANAGVRLGKDFTPVFGLALGYNMYFSEPGRCGMFNDEFGYYHSTHRGIDAFNTTLLLKVNVLNVFKYDPNRKFNVSIYAGPGWLYNRGYKEDDIKYGATHDLSGNFALNLSYDLTKRLSVYVEPALIYQLTHACYSVKHHAVEFNADYAMFQLNAGLTYKFGATDFTKTKYVTYTDYARLNDEVNALRARQPETVTKVVEKVVVNKVTSDKMYIVNFEKAKYDLTETAKATLDKVEKGTQVRVKATASPEGTTEFNQTLSVNRADAVKTYLVNRGVNVLSADGLGVTGDDSQRVAVVVVE